MSAKGAEEESSEISSHTSDDDTTTDDSEDNSEEEDSALSQNLAEKSAKTQEDGKTNDEESDEFAFEESAGATSLATGSLANNNMSSTREDEAKTSYVKNAAYDEAMELNDSVNSVMSTNTAAAGSSDPSKPAESPAKDTQQIKDAQYDEALELSDTQSSLNTVDTSADAAALAAGRGAGATANSNRVYGQNHDEELELSSDTVNTVDTAVAEAPGRNKKPEAMANISESSDMSDSSSDLSDSEDAMADISKARPADSAAASQKTAAPTQSSANSQWSKQRKNSFSGSSSSSGSSDSESDDEGKSAENNKYTDLKVGREISKLFEFIKAFKPTQHDLDTKLKCFIPDFIPSIGDMDPFVKIHRPDGKNDELGLKILDEPHAQQSQRTVLELQLRAQTKRLGMNEVQIQSIANAEKNPGAIKAWIDSMENLHREKPLPTVTYKKPMPDIETLMQVWPAEFEEFLKEATLPSGNIDLTIKEYASVLCALLDVPIHESTVQSLHVIFTLYAEFKANQHFQAVPGDADEVLTSTHPRHMSLSDFDSLTDNGADTLKLDATEEDTKDDSDGAASDNEEGLFNDF